MVTSQIPYEYLTSFGEADEKEKLAQYLTRLAEQQRPGAGQMVGKIFVKAHPLQHLASVLSQAQAGWLTSEAERKRRQALQDLAMGQRNELAQIASMMTGRVPQSAPGDFGPGEAPTVGPQEGAPANPIGASQAAMASSFPVVREFGARLRDQLARQFSTLVPHATPESAIASGGDPRRLQPKPPERYGEMQNIALPGQPPVWAIREQTTGKPIFPPQAPSTTVNVNTGEKLQHDLTKHDYEQLFSKERTQGARDTVKALSNANAAFALLKTTPINWGVDSEVKTFAQRLAGILGKEIPPNVPATQLYESFIVPTIREFLKPLGAGTGVSDKDREFAEKALAMANRDPRMAEAALLFSIRGLMKEMQQYETDIRSAAATAPSAARAHFEGKIPKYQVTIPRGVNLPDDIFAPGVLEEYFADQILGRSSSPKKKGGGDIQLPPDAERVLRKYLSR